MKEIIYNEENLTEKDINRIIRRTKLIIENSKEEIILINNFNDYMLPGGHVEDDEQLKEALIREIKEELGITLENKIREPILTIKYFKKNYPIEEINTKYIGYYYAEKLDITPNLELQELSNEEIIGDFKIEFISKHNIINLLENKLNNCTDKEVINDTLSAIKEYLSKN